MSESGRRQQDGDSGRHKAFWVPTGCRVGATYGGLVTAVTPAYRISEPAPFTKYKAVMKSGGATFLQCVSAERRIKIFGRRRVWTEAET